MREVLRRVSVMLAVATVAGAGIVQGQTPPPQPAPAPGPPPGPWAGNAGFGLSLNRGNTATTNLNVTSEATYDPKTSMVWKFKGLYLRGKNNGQLAVDRLFLDGRDELKLTERVYAFAELQFLKDHFKAIDYLVAPSGGVGYKLVATPVTSFNVDGGFGVKIEKDDIVCALPEGCPGLGRRTDPVFTASDKFEHKLSPTASITQSFSSLWKAQDFGDALYNFGAGVAAALTARTQLKIELLDTYASRPPTTSVKKNDVAVLTALVYKF
jgi:putative salt-induced outer membrane protein